MDLQAPGRGCEGPLRGLEAGRGRPLPASARHHREDPGSAVPPRGVQPVPLEPVLADVARWNWVAQRRVSPEPARRRRIQEQPWEWLIQVFATAPPPCRKKTVS